MQIGSLGKFNCSSGVINILYNDNIKNIAVRTSTVKDYLLVDKLQKENSFAVGFIQKTIWEEYVWGGKRNFMVFICEANGDAVGYILMTPGIKEYDYAKIQQIVIRNDARRLQYGTALISVCKEFCEKFNRSGATLRCRIDLESNSFWEKLGFKIYGIWEKGRINHVNFKASKDINQWIIHLNNNIKTFWTIDELYPTHANKL